MNAKIQKSIMRVKKILFRILLHVVLKMVNVSKVLLTIQRLRVMKLQTRQLSPITTKQQNVLPQKLL